MASGAAKALASELKDLMRTPLEGVQVKLADEDGNLFRWEVAIFGPPDTIYTGGYFKAHITFPQTYPFDPPTMKFLQSMFHPNVYALGDRSGEICISILHPPGEDATSGELPEERWSPAQRVRTILLSVISLLNEPNTFSPADVDASVAYRKWREGTDDTFKERVLAAVERSKAVAAQDGVEIPTTLEDYCIKTSTAAKESDADDWTMTMDDDYDDADFDMSDDYGEDSEGEEDDNDNDGDAMDSGNE